MARGRIFKRHGGYAFRVDLGPDPATGRRRQIQRQGFRTKREVEAALEEHLTTIRTGGAPAGEDRPVRPWIMSATRAGDAVVLGDDRHRPRRRS